MAEPTQRYQVLKKVHVNGQLIDPNDRPDVFVMARPGLEGRALKAVGPDQGRPAAQSAPETSVSPDQLAAIRAEIEAELEAEFRADVQDELRAKIAAELRAELRAPPEKTPPPNKQGR